MVSLVPGPLPLEVNRHPWLTLSVANEVADLIVPLKTRWFLVLLLLLSLSLPSHTSHPITRLNLCKRQDTVKRDLVTVENNPIPLQPDPVQNSDENGRR